MKQDKPSKIVATFPAWVKTLRNKPLCKGHVDLLHNSRFDIVLYFKINGVSRQIIINQVYMKNMIKDREHVSPMGPPIVESKLRQKDDGYKANQVLIESLRRYYLDNGTTKGFWKKEPLI